MVVPPVRVIRPAVVIPVPPVRKLPKPLMMPVAELERGRLLLSKVQPLLVMVPALDANPCVYCTVDVASTMICPPAGLVELAPEIVNFPPLASMMPVLSSVLLIRPSPVMEPLLLIAPPLSAEGDPCNSMVPLLGNAVVPVNVEPF